MRISDWSADVCSSDLPVLPVDQRAADLVRRMTITEKAAQMQNGAPGIERLGVLPYDYWNEALHGVARAGEATVFPQAIGMAATFDRALFHAEGQVIATEGRAPYNQEQRERNRPEEHKPELQSPM